MNVLRNRNNIIAIIIFIMFVTTAFAGHHIGAANNEQTLEKLARGMENEGVIIKEWSLYTKKSVDLESMEKVKQMTEQFRDYTWAYEEKGDIYKAIGTKVNKEKKVTEKLQILSTLKNHHSGSYILYELKGKTGQTSWNEMNRYFKKQAFHIFQEELTIFSCITGEIGDMMEGVLLTKSNDLLKQFNALPIEQLNEEKFVSISAKTEEWNESIPTNKGSMNVQIALRSAGLGDFTTVVVGTPIITSEY